MTIAQNLISFLQQNHAKYSVVAHPHSASSKETVKAAQIPPEKLAKAVILKDKRGYVMAVVPANRHVDLGSLSNKLGRRMEFVPETRFSPIFSDCEPGAIPPVGPAYGMETILDDSLVGQSDIYFEAGDHEELIHMNGDHFLHLLKEARHGQFCE